MALFAFADLQSAPASLTLRDALQVDAEEPLLARRLRGVGHHDRGRRAIEIIVPSRLPTCVNLRAEGLLNQNLDAAAPPFKYGKYHQGELQARYRASELVILHDWQHYEGPEYAIDPDTPAGEQPELVLLSETEDESFHAFAILALFDPPSWWEPLRWVQRMSRPGDRWWRALSSASNARRFA